MQQERTRYAIVGTGGRHVMYRNALMNLFANQAELVALCDLNEGRLALSRGKILQHAGFDMPVYSHDRFDQMVTEQKPDTVIVTTKDSAHDEYICRALEAGCDVVTEKPLTTDADKLKRIVDTQQRTGGKVTVTFNYRYSPPRGQVKQLLDDGVIGEVYSVDFQWLLDTRHGADYFRRWHRQKANSGGLLVHKATHHFDLVNWWLNSVPESVFATGSRRYYQEETATRLGLTNRSERCIDCAASNTCPHFMDLSGHRGLRELYRDQEGFDGYYRDGCVFSDEIDIEDTMGLKVTYRSGAIMNYSLFAYSPWEGYRIAFNGSKGRLEHDMIEGSHIIGDGTVPGRSLSVTTRVCPHFEPDYEIDVAWEEGGHGGGDPILLDHLFMPGVREEDTLGRYADFRSGAWSVMTGICANESIRVGREIRVDEMIEGLPLPDGIS